MKTSPLDTCKHEPVTRECHCGLKYKLCPICEPDMVECISCQEEARAYNQRLQRMLSENWVMRYIPRLIAGFYEAHWVGAYE